MHAEVSIGGIYVPGLLLLAIGLGLLFWMLEAVAGRWAPYRLVWHPPLFRAALFVCLFGLLGLILF